jgi:N-methylhydantoinase A
VTVRIAAHGVVDKPAPHRHVASGTAHRETRPAWFDGAERSVEVYEREGLATGAALRGPAIVEEFGATSVVPPGWIARLDGLGNLRLERA